MIKNKPAAWRFGLVLITLAACLLSSCGTFIPTEAPVTLTFGFPLPDQAYYQSLLPGFKEKYPNITVTLKAYEDGPQEDMDVFIVPWSLVMDNTTAQAGLLPLDSYIGQEKDFQLEDFYPGVIEAFRVDGEQIAIPSGVDPWVMYYNKDLFDRYGVPYPQPGWTWTDFLAIAQAVRHPEDQVYGYANMDGYTDSLFFLYQHGGALGDSSGKPTLNSIENVEAVAWYASLYRDFQVAPTTEQAQHDFTASRSPTIFGLINGKIGMFIGNLSIRGGNFYFPTPWNFKYGVAALPRDQQAFTGAIFDGIGISKKSLNPDAGWKWVSYISKKPHNRLVPARISLASSPEYAQLVGDEIAQAGRDSMTDALLISNQNIGQFSGFLDIFVSSINTLVNKDVIVQEELDKAQIQAEKKTP